MSESEAPALSNPSSAILNIRTLPTVLSVAVLFGFGIQVGESLPLSPGHFLVATAAWLLSGVVLHRKCNPRAATLSIAVFIVGLGICRWQLQQYSASPNLRELVDHSGTTVNLRATVHSVPAVHVKPSSELSPRLFGAAQQTRFEIDAESIASHDGDVPVSGRCLVYVEGDASDIVSVRDEITLTGQLQWPGPPDNPGEFDFASFLHRRQIAALFFVQHTRAIRTVSAVSRTDARYWLGTIRKEAQSVLTNNVATDVQGIALALLLGERNQIPSETERAFVASGTMHLLAISGLHVGILCLFVLRICNLLIIRRKSALLITMTICIAYAYVTDLRPSVVRATVFFAVFVFGELTHRQITSLRLLAITAVLMLLWQPQLVFDHGAWLSFLSVFALGLVDLQRMPDDDSDVPADTITWSEQLRHVLTVFGKWLRYRYSQMLAILALTTPLVALTFNVLSPIGLVVNVLLIPATAVALCLGFVTLAIGILLPPAAFAPGYVFSGLLELLAFLVRSTSDVNSGHLYIADFSPTLVVAYYVLAATALLLPVGKLRRTVIASVLICAVLAISNPGGTQNPEGLRCTVLNVGHGNATIVEFSNGKVMVVDAGAMNRGARTADLICGYLWHRGYRSINGLVISHADMDHYNAVPEIISRIPVGEVITTQRFIRSDSDAVQILLSLLERREIPVHIASDSDVAVIADATVKVVEAAELSDHVADNEKSLLVEITYGGRRLMLPGDIEGEGARQVLPRVSPVDVLVSPHHGATSANNEFTAETLKPKNLIVSARDTSTAAHLNAIFSEADSIRFTAVSGAVTINVLPDGCLDFREFVASHTEAAQTADAP